MCIGAWSGHFLRGMIGHVIPHYLWGLIDKTCGDLAPFPRSVEFHWSLSARDLSKGERCGEKCCCECRRKMSLSLFFLLTSRGTNGKEITRRALWIVGNQNVRMVMTFWRLCNFLQIFFYWWKHLISIIWGRDGEGGVSFDGGFWTVSVDQRLRCLDWSWLKPSNPGLMLLTVQCEP